jgi:hypothetical protein
MMRSPLERCVACLTGFIPMRPEHRLCRRCWAWVAMGRALRQVRARAAEATR